MKNIIQIAGVRDLQEAMLLASLGADYIGFPLRLSHHPDDLSEEEVTEIINHLPAAVITVLITYLITAEDIRELVSCLKVSTVQLHGEIKSEEIVRLRRFLPHLRIIKSLIVGQYSVAELVSQIQEFTPLVDIFITDTYDPVNGATGATGKTHDWQISHQLVESSSLPVILAGGLNPGNVEEAILTVKPFGVDVHTGVENAAGEKDLTLVKEFISRARKAFSKIRSMKL